MTEPINDLHPGDDENVSEILKQFSDIITETVNHGTHVLKWEVTEASGSDENIPIAMMLRHILEMTDAISILVKKSSIDPCKPLLRGVLEVLFGLEYILKENTKDRALGFLVWHQHKELAFLKNTIPGTQSSTQFLQKMEASSLTSGIISDITNKIDINGHIANIEKLLNLPLYQPIEIEYQRIITNERKVKQWFQLFSNIKTFEQLSIYLNNQQLYEILYRSWSGPVHGTDIVSGKLSKSTNGNAEMVQIRYVKDAQIVTHYAVTLCLMTYNAMINNRLKSHRKEHQNWYLTIRDEYMQLSGPDLIKIT